MDASSSSIRKYMISLLSFSKDYGYACERGAHWGEVTPFLVAFCFKRSPPFPTEPFVASSLAARAKARGWVPGDAVCRQCFQRNSYRLVNKIFHTLTLTLNVRKNTAQMEFLPRDKTRWLDERLCFGVLDNWPPSGWFSKLWAPKLECYLQNESNFYLIFGDSERLEINPTVSQSLPWTMGIPAVIGETFQTGHFDGISTELCHWTDLAVRSTILLCLWKSSIQSFTCFHLVAKLPWRA